MKKTKKKKKIVKETTSKISLTDEALKSVRKMFLRLVKQECDEKNKKGILNLEKQVAKMADMKLRILSAVVDEEISKRLDAFRTEADR